MKLHFYERPNISICFPNQGKSEEDFCFNERKAKIAFTICFAAANIEAVCTPSIISSPIKLLPGKPHLAS